jgi:hypothetical protein
MMYFKITKDKLSYTTVKKIEKCKWFKRKGKKRYKKVKKIDEQLKVLQIQVRNKANHRFEQVWEEAKPKLL